MWDFDGCSRGKFRMGRISYHWQHVEGIHPSHDVRDLQCSRLASQLAALDDRGGQANLLPPRHRCLMQVYVAHVQDELDKYHIWLGHWALRSQTAADVRPCRLKRLVESAMRGAEVVGHVLGAPVLPQASKVYDAPTT